jgi:acetyltransferase EpsM
MKKLFVWGAGGHGKVVVDVARASGRYSEILLIDDASSGAAELSGCRIVSTPIRSSNRGTPEGEIEVVIAIGSNRDRAHCFARALQYGWQPATLIHPSASVSPEARIGAGTVVMPRAVVNSGAEIGNNCIINSAAIVEHDCKVGDHVHLSPAVALGGAVHIAAFAHLGIGAIALPGAAIGQSATVGAGSVVLRSVQAGETVVGVPAQPIRTRALSVLPRRRTA